MSKRRDPNRERSGEAPGPIDRALDRDRDDRMDALEGGAEGRTARGRAAEGEVRVPVAEERLNVEKRQGQIGEVQVRKTVEQEQQTVPVELEREDVRVDKRDVGDRPAQGEDLFREGTIRVPVRGEQAEVTKEAVVTGEVVVGKEQTTQREQVADTVRRERVEVDQDYEQGRAAAPPATGPTQRQTSRGAEPQPRQSSGAGEGWEQLREQVREDSKQ